MPVSGLKPAAVSHFDRVHFGESDPHPGVVRFEFKRGIALQLEFEQSSRKQQAMRLSHVVFYNFVAGDMLENDGGKREIKRNRGNHIQVFSIVLIKESVGPVRAGFARKLDHLAAYVHSVYFAESIR